VVSFRTPPTRTATPIRTESVSKKTIAATSSRTTRFSRPLRPIGSAVTFRLRGRSSVAMVAPRGMGVSVVMGAWCGDAPGYADALVLM
jgi:hypothetical protein